MTNDDLVENMLGRGFLKSKKIIAAFKDVDRKNFILNDDFKDAYRDQALWIGYGQTISQPSTVAFMLEKLDVKSGNKVLDVGSGSGWTTALLANLAGENGRVYGVERIPELVNFGQNNIAKLNIKGVAIRQASENLGLKSEGPFDRILVSAEARELPQELIKQLKPGGTLVLPINESVVAIRKDLRGQIHKDVSWGFVFVPLVK